MTKTQKSITLLYVKKDFERGMKVLRANYHTHTYRCKHAEPDERKYIEHAIRAGIAVLGFSEHAPLDFGNGYSSTYRMEVSEIEDYINTLCALKEEYKSDIDIKIGLEAEYYPEYFDSLLKSIEGYPFEYLILGQHFIDNEYEQTRHCAAMHDDSEFFKKYISQVCAGMDTGKFSYLAHPDMMCFTGDERIYDEQLQKLFDKAKQQNMPLEINFNGAKFDRMYPSERFFKKAKEAGCKIILGVDAHSADMLDDTALYDKVMALVNKCGITPVDEIEYRL